MILSLSSLSTMSPYLYNTFKKGTIGLWTKADAVTAFDDIKAKEILP